MEKHGCIFFSTYHKKQDEPLFFFKWVFPVDHASIPLEGNRKKTKQQPTGPLKHLQIETPSGSFSGNGKERPPFLWTKIACKWM